MANEFQLRQQICDIGHRIWLRGYCSGNEGNLSVRIGPDRVLCTPTLVSKGFLKPADICTVDMDGKQLDGQKPRTSEILIHLQLYKARPDIQAVVHAHPPHLTAFAVARRNIPLCVTPEMEVFVGQVPIAEYATPGTEDLAKTLLPYVDKVNTVLLANHGAVCWSKSLEDAYFKMEVADSYCRILILAAHLGGATQLPDPQVRELLGIKEKLGITDDPRLKCENVDLCSNDLLGRGITVNGRTGQADGQAITNEQQFEQLVQQITDRIMANTGG